MIGVVGGKGRAGEDVVNRKGASWVQCLQDRG